MQSDEILRKLSCYQLSHGADRTKRVPINVIARMSGVHRTVLYDLLRAKRPMRPHEKEKLEAVLEALDGRKVDIKRDGQVWGGEYREPPAVLPPPQDKMILAEDWNEWSRCRVCHGQAYTRVTLHGTKRLWYLCDGCLWWETAGMGAKRA